MGQIFWSLLWVASMFPAQERDTLRYEYWANCKVGSWVKYKMTGSSSGGDLIVTETLLELTPEKAVVQTTLKSSAAGQAPEPPAIKQDVKAKDSKAEKIVAEKEEEVTVAGKTLKCRAVEYEAETPRDKISGKAWMTKEIPGGAAKGEFTSGKSKVTFKTETLEWEKK
jgi:hypothetical protein